MDYKIPKTMEKEHEELHAELRKPTTAGDATGKNCEKASRGCPSTFRERGRLRLATSWAVAFTVKRQSNLRHEGHSADDRQAEDRPQPDA